MVVSAPSTHQVRRPRERVCLPAASLPVAEDSGGEPVHGHVDQPLHARVLQDVLLRRLGLEHHVESERLQLAVLPFLFVNLRSTCTH